MIYSKCFDITSVSALKLASEQWEAHVAWSS